MQFIQSLSSYITPVLYLLGVALFVLGIIVLLKANKLLKLKIQKETAVKRPELSKKAKAPIARTPVQK